MYVSNLFFKFFKGIIQVVLLSFLMSGENLAISQESFVCGFEENVYQTPSGIFSCSTDPAFLDTFELKVFKIHFWQVNDPYGNTTVDGELTENLILESVAKLNIEYNQYRIFFKYTGFSTFNSPFDVQIREYDQDGDCYNTEIFDQDGYSVLHACQVDEMFDYAESSGAKDPNAFNVYVPRELQSLGGRAQEKGRTTVVVPIIHLTDNVLIHEIGHCLGLSHTHEFYYSCNCERADGSNSCDTGDRVADTNAVPNFRNEFCYFETNSGDCGSDICKGDNTQEYYNILDYPYCDYIGFNFDCTGAPYTINTDDVKNYMAYTKSLCSDRFTIGQGIRMLETIAWDPYYEFGDAETGIDQLFLPYKGQYYHAGPAPDPHTQPLFQPGFDYTFVACSCENQDSYDCVNGPCDFDQNGFQSYTIIIDQVDKYETDYHSITHPNHSSIYIAQLDDVGNRMCYDNYNKSASFGSITQFNDGVFNTNVSVVPQDSTQINNPSLIDNLDPGLYVIDKIYDDGSQQQSVLQKNGNQ